MTQHSPRVYDHRIREQVVRTGNPDLFPEFESPRKTALSWIRRGMREVVTLDDQGWEPAHHVRIAKLERRVAMLSAILRLVLALLRISGYELERTRVPDAADKRRLLAAIERACCCCCCCKAMPLSAARRVLGLSSSRYHAWVNANDACTLDDVVMDSGVENLNGTVDELFDSSALRHVIAQIDVSFSNSLIEAWWRILKHQWLYLHSLDDRATVRKLVAFYVTQHNETMPHITFQGQTPDEVYFGRGDHVPD